MSLIIDILLLGILIFCFLHGYKRGFVRSVTSFIGYLIAAFLSSALGNFLSISLYRSLLREPMIEKVTQFLEENASAAASQQAELFFEQLPGFAANLLTNEGITPAALSESFSGAAVEIAPQIVDLISPSIINLSRILITVVLFSIFLFVVRVVVRTVSSIFRLPGLRQINGTLGALFGLFSGVIIVMLLCAVMHLASPLLENAGITQQAVKQSYLYQIVYENNPIYSLFQEN